jgi:hypothetical protein
MGQEDGQEDKKEQEQPKRKERVGELLGKQEKKRREEKRKGAAYLLGMARWVRWGPLDHQRETRVYGGQ